MKEKILSALKTKYKTFGFGEKAFDGVADYLSKTITDEEQIETAISGVESLLKAFQGDIDSVRTEKSKLQKEYEELKKRSMANPDEKKEEPTTDMPEWFKVYKAEQDAKIEALTKENETSKAEKSKAERLNLINSKAKELKISKERIDEGFAISDEMDEEAISNYLSKVRQNEVAKGLEDERSAFSISTPKAVGEELAKEWAESLPDKD